MARRASSSRVRGVRPEQAISAPYVKRIFPFFDPLDMEQIEKLEQQVDWLIENIGIAFRDDPSSIELWKKVGAKVDGDIVRAPADWIRDLCRKAPSQFTQLARNPARSVVIGGDNQVLPLFMEPHLYVILKLVGVMAISRPFVIWFG